MNTTERTRPHAKRSRRLGLSLAALAVAAAVAFGLWFFLGREDPKQKLQAAMDNTLTPASGLMQDEDGGRRQFHESLYEGYTIDASANIPVPEFGALQFSLSAQGSPADALSAGHVNVAMGTRELLSAAMYGDSRALQVMLGSEEAGRVYELPYGDPDFEAQLAASPFGPMFAEETAVLQDLMDSYHEQIAQASSPEAARRREQLKQDLAEQLDSAEQDFLESLQAEAAGTEELTLDGETVRGEIITWTAEHEAVLDYFDALYRSLRQTLAEADSGSPFIDLSALGIPKDELPEDDYFAALDEAYSELRADMAKTPFTAAGEAVVADQKLYELEAEFTDEEGTVQLTLLFVSHTKQTPLDHFDLTFTAAGTDELALESLRLSREKHNTGNGGYTDTWIFPAEDDSLVFETIVGDPSDRVHPFSVTLKDDSGSILMSVGGHYRDGAEDKHYSVTIDEIVFDELNVADEYGLELFFETSPQTIVPLSRDPKNILELTPQDWTELQQYFTPFFGLVSWLIA